MTAVIKNQDVTIRQHLRNYQEVNQYRDLLLLTVDVAGLLALGWLPSRNRRLWPQTLR